MKSAKNSWTLGTYLGGVSPDADVVTVVLIGLPKPGIRWRLRSRGIGSVTEYSRQWIRSSVCVSPCAYLNHTVHVSYSSETKAYHVTVA